MSATAVQVREHPILFSGGMVRAILDGGKTQTRRVVKPQPWIDRSTNDGKLYWLFRSENHPKRSAWPENGEPYWMDCPYGDVGDRLWVRESAYIAPPNFSDNDAINAKHWDYRGVPRIVGYAASMSGESVRCATDYGVKKIPSIHVPRWASRITLEITDVRVERLMDISDDDIRAEGIDVADDGTGNVRAAWANGWNAINEKRGYSWLSNPWVWVLEFKKL